jgi:C4-dicarboxylate-specific signal transduction histidine kinase
MLANKVPRMTNQLTKHVSIRKYKSDPIPDLTDLLLHLANDQLRCSRRVAHDIKSPLSNAERGSHTTISWKNAVSLIETVFMEKRAVYPNIKIRMDIDQYLDDDFLVAGEAIGLGRIFSNIIQNAIEATSDLNLQLNVRIVKTASGLRFHFIDNGTGFVQDLVGTFGLGELTTKNSGQGIGLSSAAEYLAAISGTLKLNNQPGGAEVIVDLPFSTHVQTQFNRVIKK